MSRLQTTPPRVSGNGKHYWLLHELFPTLTPADLSPAVTKAKEAARMTGTVLDEHFTTYFTDQYRPATAVTAHGLRLILFHLPETQEVSDMRKDLDNLTENMSQDDYAHDTQLSTVAGMQLRSVTIDGEHWYAATDLAKMLGYRGASDVTRRLAKHDLTSLKVKTSGGPQALTFINTNGLHTAVMRSNRPESERYRQMILTPQQSTTITTTPTALTPQSFNYAGMTLRAIMEDGEPLFVLKDIADILGQSDAGQIARRLDEGTRALRLVETGVSTPQQMVVVTEEGLLTALLRSNAPQAKPFRKWVTREVLPALIRTGTYSLPTVQPAQELQGEALLAKAVLEAQRMLEQAKPAVEFCNKFLDASNDYSVADVAKLLCGAGVETGRDRLFVTMDTLGWTYRHNGERRPYQRYVDSGYLTVRLGHYSGRNGQPVATSTIRITPKGLTRLAKELGVTNGDIRLCA